MKKLMYLFAGIFLFNSCQEKTDPYVPSIDFQSDKKAAQLIAADNVFAFELFKEVDQLAEEENYMVSPLSVAIALGMTYNGSDGSTKTAFEETLGFSGFTRHEINTIHGALIEHLLKVDPKVTFEIANSIWVNQNYTLLSEFADSNAYYYGAEIRSMNFYSPDALGIINGWVSDKTHEKITEVLDAIPPATVMYLINALYFYGSWQYEFDKEQSAPMNFTFEDGSSDMVDGMAMTATLPIAYQDKYTAIDLPYGSNKFSMTVLLPKDNFNVDNIIEEMNAQSWEIMTGNLTETNLTLRMPKFKYEFKTLLNDHLANMGLGVAFRGGAEFPLMVEESQDLYISRVIHKTFIDVNEEGTEAAAVTVVEIRETSTGGGELTINIDKPFLYVIREKTSGTLVFMGKVGNPG
ncbi:MAG: serpin family protein [Bacteroidales bacterium]|nr:serpin family protein [Bacteroidales bacterium]MCF8389451.1 serpin family protein [Bacteroidales bacterium]